MIGGHFRHSGFQPSDLFLHFLDHFAVLSNGRHRRRGVIPFESHRNAIITDSDDISAYNLINVIDAGLQMLNRLLVRQVESWIDSIDKNIDRKNRTIGVCRNRTRESKNA